MIQTEKENKRGKDSEGLARDRNGEWVEESEKKPEWEEQRERARENVWEGNSVRWKKKEGVEMERVK